jgi:glycosyltransferase involved in cell wall biosynthesis
MFVTVSICTWNRSALLDQTLNEMHRLQIPPGIDWEILVVNNNCTDNTDEVIARHVQDLPIRRLFEVTPGLSNARNSAIGVAQGELLLWTDDDVLVAPDWLSEYVAAARAWPASSFFGGTIDPWFAVEPPTWIRRHMQRLDTYWAVRQLGEVVRPLEPGEFPFGANVAFRTDVLRRYGFDPGLGNKGWGKTGGDDIDVMERMIAAGEAGVWVGTARVRHYIPAERLTARYVWRISYGQGQWRVRKGEMDECSGTLLLGAPRWLFRKYLEARLRSLLFAVGGGEAWLDWYIEAAIVKGKIDELRKRARNGKAIINKKN